MPSLVRLGEKVGLLSFYTEIVKGASEMPGLSERTVIDLGQGSYVVCLPKAWLRYYGLKPGDKVEVISNGEITIRPKRKGPEANKASFTVEGMGSTKDNE